MTNKEISALIPTLSERPAVYFDLVRKLVDEGFIFDHKTAEWIDSTQTVRGRICWQVNSTQNRAWLRHWDNKQSHEIER